MNNSTRIRLAPIALAAAVALAIPSARLLAQPGPGPHHGRGQMLERLLERLDLTEDQRASIHEVMLAQRERTRELHEAKTAARRALGETIHADALDEGAVRRAAADVAAVDADLAVMRARMFQEINKTLSAEQRQRMKTLIEDWHYMADEFREQGPGRGPGPGWSE
jgi:Spy/CpxP family protein refolding chaperone